MLADIARTYKDERAAAYYQWLALRPEARAWEPYFAGEMFIPADRGLLARRDLALLLNSATLNGEAAEIGVWVGNFTVPFLDKWLGKKLWAVDPWAKLDDYKDIRNDDFDPMDYQRARKRFAPYGPRVAMVRMRSEEAARSFPDASLDFVYIDANHDFEHVTQDIRLWWPKVRPGGMLAGHDILSTEHPSVTDAVIFFCNQWRVQASIIPGFLTPDGQTVAEEASWYVWRPKA